LTATTTPIDAEIVSALKRGDGDAFTTLVTTLHPALVRYARMYLSGGVAEEVVQDTWESVVTHLDQFEGRASLKSWIYRILLNTIRTRAVREARVVPFASTGPQAGGSSPSIEPGRLVHEELGTGYWPAAPSQWETLPEDRLLSGEVRTLVANAVAALHPAQREVITMRDIDGWTAEEVCDALGITSVNQRVLLHRARAIIRRSLEEYFDG